MKIICKMLGGSHSYGLNTPTSDVDYRGVFLNTDVSTIIGLDRFEHQDLKSETEDSFYWELRHFLNLLRRGNTQGLELLFNQYWLEKDPVFQQVIDARDQLLDTKAMFRSLKGYIYSERRLANGERSGQLGGKRRAEIEKYGFSPKNFVQLLRLCWAGTWFFRTGRFPVNVKDAEPTFWSNLHDIKTKPDQFKKDELNAWVDRLDAEMCRVFDAMPAANHREFDVQTANKLLVDAYMPVLQQSQIAPVAQLARVGLS